MAKKLKLTIKEYNEHTDDSLVFMHKDNMDTLKAEPGDILFISHPSPLYGALFSTQARAGEPFDDDSLRDLILMSKRKIEETRLAEDRTVKVEKVL